MSTENRLRISACVLATVLLGALPTVQAVYAEEAGSGTRDSGASNSGTRDSAIHGGSKGSDSSVGPSGSQPRGSGDAVSGVSPNADDIDTRITVQPHRRPGAKVDTVGQAKGKFTVPTVKNPTPPGVFRVRSIEPNGAKHCQRADQSAGIVGATRRRASSFRLRAAPARRCDRHGWTHGARNGQIRNRIWPSDYGSPDRQPDHRESRNQRNERWSSGREFSGHRRTGQNGRRH